MIHKAIAKKISNTNVIISDSFQRGGKRKWLLLLFIPLLIGAYLAISYVVVTRNRANELSEVVTKSQNDASTYRKTDVGYSFTQLTSAVEYAQKKKCDEAKAIINDVKKHPNGLQSVDISLTEKRVAEMCK